MFFEGLRVGCFGYQKGFFKSHTLQTHFSPTKTIFFLRKMTSVRKHLSKVIKLICTKKSPSLLLKGEIFEKKIPYQTLQ